MQATYDLLSRTLPRKRRPAVPDDIEFVSTRASLSNVDCHECSCEIENEVNAHFIKEGDATADCRNTLHVKPSSPEYWINLGSVLQKAGRYGEARTAFREARRLTPLDANAALSLACLEMECGRYQRAYDLYRAVLDKSPQRVDVRIRAARACYELGHEKGAKSLVEDWPFWDMTGDMSAELAALMVLLGRRRDGLFILKRVSHLSRIGTRALVELASAFGQANSLKKARQCLALLPSAENIRIPALREEVLTICARMALQNGNLPGARKLLEFLNAPPDAGIWRSAKPYFLLAEICYHQSDMDGVQSALMEGWCWRMKGVGIAPPLMRQH